MLLIKVQELLKQYQDCPECGNDKIGAGSGALIVDDNRFERSCRCGWRVVIELPGGKRK